MELPLRNVADFLTAGLKTPKYNLDHVVHYKVFLVVRGYEPEHRRMFIDNDFSHNYLFLRQKLKTNYPVLDGLEFVIYWKDKDGDRIRISSDEELQIFLKDTEADALRKIIIFGEDDSQGVEHKEDGPVHPNVTCDGCEGVIHGFRYKCIVCSNYDLCADCEREQVHPDHPVLRIPVPLSPEFPFGKRFSKVIHKMYKHFDQLIRQNEKAYSEKKGRGDGPCQESGDVHTHHKRHEKKIKSCCPFTVCTHLNSGFAGFAYGRKNLFEQFQDGSRKEQPCSGKVPVPPPPYETPTFIVEDQQKTGLPVVNIVLPPQRLPSQGYAAVQQCSSPTTKTQQGESVPSYEHQPQASSETTAEKDVTKCVTDDKIIRIGYGTPGASMYVNVPENSTVLDGTWTVVNNPEGDGQSDPSCSPSTSASNDTVEQAVPDTAKIYPAIPVSPINPSGQNVSDVVDDTLRKMIAMGFSDEGGWLRQLIENKNGNLQEVLKFLSPIPKPQPEK